MKAKFDRFVHEFEDSKGNTRYAVAEWIEEANQYQRPLSVQDQELTGCHTEYTGHIEEFGGYLSRTKALRRARYLFAPVVALDEILD